MEASTSMGSMREHLLMLDKKKKEIETQIMSLTESLNAQGMPGIYLILYINLGLTSPLVDKEGFPLAGVDIYGVRTMRNKLVYLKNDHTTLMKQIDIGINLFFHIIYRAKTIACTL